MRGRSEKAQEPGYYSQAVPAWTGPPPPPDNPRTLAPSTFALLSPFSQTSCFARDDNASRQTGTGCGSRSHDSIVVHLGGGWPRFPRRRLRCGPSCVVYSLVGGAPADRLTAAWRMATTQGQWVAFALLAACSFGWLCTPIITSGYLQDLKKTRLAWFALLVSALSILDRGAANERSYRLSRLCTQAWPLTSRPPHSNCATDTYSGSGEQAPWSSPADHRLTVVPPATAAKLDGTGMRSRAAGAVRRGRSLRSAW